MTDPRPAQGGAHASHDLFVIAAAADRDADPTARAVAEAQARDCAECASLLADLQAISTGLATLPRELPAPRDFRLTPDRAASLRRRGWRTSLDGLFRSPSLRPFGNALATIGFAGLLLTVGLPAVLGGFGGGAASAPAILSNGGQSTGGYPAAAASPASAPEISTSGSGKAGPTSVPADNAAASDASGGAAQGTAAPAPNASGAYAYGAASSPTSSDRLAAEDQSNGRGSYGPLAPSTPDPLSYLPWLSLGAFLVGIALLGMARLGGRARTRS